MKHKLYLDLYSFKFNEKGRNGKELSNNDFLSRAYSSVTGNKFDEGFTQQIINLLDKKLYKNKEGTRGAILEDKILKGENRIFDILINGGTTGLKQYIINQEGKQDEIDKEDVVGLKFYARFWLPSGSKTGFIFIQKYGGISIKPIFDSIINDLIEPLKLRKSSAKLKATTTKKRMKEFLKHSNIKDITIIGDDSNYSTGGLNSSAAEIRLKGINSVKELSKKEIIKKAKKDLEGYGFNIADRDYKVKAKFEYKVNKETTQERTIYLGVEEDYNIVPNILIGPSLINPDNSPKFKEIGLFVDKEIRQLEKEAKIK